MGRPSAVRWHPLVCQLALLGSPAALAQSDPAVPPLFPVPRPAVVPAEVAVGDPGANERLPDDLLAHYRPSTAVAAVAASTSFTHPLAGPAEEIDPYGWRWSESRQAWRMHAGIDLVAAEGMAIRAVWPGTVRLVDVISGYGLTVVVDHGDGLRSLYAHLLDVAVRPGERLVAGRTLGRLGRSGNATGPHLHFELRRRQGGGWVAVDPAPFLPRSAAQTLNPATAAAPVPTPAPAPAPLPAQISASPAPSIPAMAQATPPPDPSVPLFDSASGP